MEKTQGRKYKNILSFGIISIYIKLSFFFLDILFLQNSIIDIEYGIRKEMKKKKDSVYPLFSHKKKYFCFFPEW